MSFLGEDGRTRHRPGLDDQTDQFVDDDAGGLDLNLFATKLHIFSKDSQVSWGWLACLPEEPCWW